MRIVNLKTLLLALALAAVSPLAACGPYGDLEPSAIKFPGVAYHGILRGDYLLCANGGNRIIAVDLRRARTHDLGTTEGKRWQDGDIANAQALFLVKDRLHVITLQDGKTVHEVPIGNERIWSFGFATKGQAFVHRGNSLLILELATGKTLHTIALGEGDTSWRYCRAWQKVGNRLFVAGPATTLCVVDLETGKLRDRFSVESRAGISALHVEGSLVYFIGSASSWVPADDLTCFDMESKKTIFANLPRGVHRGGQFASGPYGTAYLIDRDRIDRFTMHGDRCGSFTTPKGEPVLGVWHHRALIAAKDQIRLLEIRETGVARK